MTTFPITITTSLVSFGATERRRDLATEQEAYARAARAFRLAGFAPIPGAEATARVRAAHSFRMETVVVGPGARWYCKTCGRTRRGTSRHSLHWRYHLFAGPHVARKHA